MDEFYKVLGPTRNKRIRLAVMDMWKPFHHSTLKPEHAPQAAILFDKFHVLRHLGEALDVVRKTEYARLTGKDRHFIKGSEVRAAVAFGKPEAGQPTESAAAAQGQQAAEHGLPPQGGVRQAVGLRVGAWARRCCEN